MKSIVQIVCFFFILFCVSPSFSMAQGNGVTTNSSSGVVIKEENGIKYLTTNIVQDSTAAAEASAPAQSASRSRSLSDFLNGDITPPPGFFEDLPILFNKLIQTVLAISALLTFFYLIWGGFQWITSGGDKGKTEKARNTIVSAVIGLIIVASSYAVLLLLLNFLGYEDLNDILNQANVSINDNTNMLTN